ncbi:MAG: nicotinamide mononucleotide transporter [Bacteroidales bacterium]|nr:nicotinamide mononucleotide transporter [Bacteroidales bacterium]
MEETIQIIYYIGLVSGIVFVIMQIFQHPWMWFMDLLMLSCVMAGAIYKHLWANSLLDAYFIVMAIVGIVKWRRIASHGTQKKKTEIRIQKMPAWVAWTSAAIACAGVPLIWYLLTFTDDPEPILDAFSFTFGIIAAWWLARAYLFQWLGWIASNVFLVWMFFDQGAVPLALMYAFCVCTSVYGFIHWKTKGKVIDGNAGPDEG